MKRRQFLQVSATSVSLAHLPCLQASNDPQSRFVWVMLRGAMDGLSALVPYGDPAYADLRQRTRIPVGDEGATALNADFALHPALSNIASWYQQGKVQMWPAVATDYRSRSHFDAQQVLESGGSAPYQLDDGWLNRAISVLQARKPNTRALAVGSAIPVSMQGAVPVESWSPSRLPEPSDDIYNRLQRLYQGDDVLAESLQSLQRTRQELGGMQMGSQGRPATDFSELVGNAATLMSAEDGPQIATLEIGGWDTHANQGAVNGRLANQFRQLDEGLAALKNGLGPLWDSTHVMLMTEFGRTARENGTGGTDHGTASLAMVLGGATERGGVMGDWPGLASSQLLDGRDLRPTLSANQLIAAQLRELWQFDASELGRVFPAGTEL